MSRVLSFMKRGSRSYSIDSLTFYIHTNKMQKNKKLIKMIMSKRKRMNFMMNQMKVKKWIMCKRSSLWFNNTTGMREKHGIFSLLRKLQLLIDSIHLLLKIWVLTSRQQNHLLLSLELRIYLIMKINKT
jgi:hypothetical protein